MKKQLPHEILLEMCKKIAGDAIWAMEMGMDEHGKYIWILYCSNERIIKKLPTDFLGSEVKTIYCRRPNS